VQLNRVRWGHQTRRVEAKQLDDGIGDTLVLIDQPNGIGNAEELKTPQDVALHCTQSDLVDFHRIVVLKFPQPWGVISQVSAVKRAQCGMSLGADTGHEMG
jgi:hypothetical protein